MHSTGPSISSGASARRSRLTLITFKVTDPDPPAKALQTTETDRSNVCRRCKLCTLSTSQWRLAKRFGWLPSNSSRLCSSTRAHRSPAPEWSGPNADRRHSLARCCSHGRFKASQATVRWVQGGRMVCYVVEEVFGTGCGIEALEDLRLYDGASRCALFSSFAFLHNRL